jgi:hypothetical protein
MCNSDVLLNRVSVKNGRIHLPDGKQYAVLALPESKDLSLPVLKKIEEMVLQGIVLVGNPPERANGLSDFPESDVELKAIAKRIWGSAEGVKSGVYNYGKGRVYAGKTVAEVLDIEQIKPDLAWEPKDDIDLEYIHRTSDDVDIYYVLNKWAWRGINDLEHRNVADLPNRYIQVNCSFRVDGDRKIERWDPISGEITPVYVYEQKDGTYSLPVSLEPEGAAFYVFTKAKKTNSFIKIEKAQEILTTGNTPFTIGASKVFVRSNKIEVLEKGEYTLTKSDGKEILINNDEISENIELEGSWQVTFEEKPTLGKPFTATFDSLISWTESEKHKIKYFSGTALYEKSFNVPKQNMADGRAYLNLGKIGDIATVKMNGEEVGVYWKPPYIADITDYIKEGENKLEISVTNLWVNRLIGDQRLAPEERKTFTNLVNDTRRYDKLSKPDADQYLRYSGLMGPVKIQFSRIYAMQKEE